MEKEEMVQNEEEQKKNEEIGTENEIVNECRTEEGNVIENILNALLKL